MKMNMQTVDEVRKSILEAILNQAHRIQCHHESDITDDKIEIRIEDDAKDAFPYYTVELVKQILLEYRDKKIIANLDSKTFSDYYYSAINFEVCDWFRIYWEALQYIDFLKGGEPYGQNKQLRILFNIIKAKSIEFDRNDINICPNDIPENIRGHIEFFSTLSILEDCGCIKVDRDALKGIAWWNIDKLSKNDNFALPIEYIYSEKSNNQKRQIITLYLTPTGLLFKEAREKHYYKMISTEGRLHLLRLLMRSKTFVRTEELAKILKKNEKYVQNAAGEINKKIRNKLGIDKLIQGEKSSGYRLCKNIIIEDVADR